MFNVYQLDFQVDYHESVFSENNFLPLNINNIHRNRTPIERLDIVYLFLYTLSKKMTI